MARVLIVHPAGEPEPRHVADRIASRLVRQGHHVVRADLRDALGADEAEAAFDAVLVGGTLRGDRHDETLYAWAETHCDRLDAVPNGLFFVAAEAAATDGGESSRRLARRFARSTGWTPDTVGRFAPGDDVDWGLVDTFADVFVAPFARGEVRARRRSRRLVTLTVMATLAGAGAAYYHRHVRPMLHDWGATTQEKERRFLGDERVPDARHRSTYAVTIDAPRTDVWPWLVQMGTGRAGWYGYDLVDNGGHPSANTILAEHQQLHEGDLLPVDPKGKVGFPVLAMEPERHLVLGMPVKGERRLPLALAGTGRGMVWAFHLESRDRDHGTRLIVRTAGSRSRHPWADAVMAPVAEAAALLMQRKQLLGIKRRSEALYRRHLRQRQADGPDPLAPAGI